MTNLAFDMDSDFYFSSRAVEIFLSVDSAWQKFEVSTEIIFVSPHFHHPSAFSRKLTVVIATWKLEQVLC